MDPATYMYVRVDRSAFFVCHHQVAEAVWRVTSAFWTVSSTSAASGSSPSRTGSGLRSSSRKYTWVSWQWVAWKEQAQRQQLWLSLDLSSYRRGYKSFKKATPLSLFLFCNVPSLNSIQSLRARCHCTSYMRIQDTLSCPNRSWSKKRTAVR